MFTWTFWRQALERAIKTLAQSAILAIGAGEFNVFQLNWQTVGGFAVGGMMLSILTSLASLPAGPDGSPSLVRTS